MMSQELKAQIDQLVVDFIAAALEDTATALVRDDGKDILPLEQRIMLSAGLLSVGSMIRSNRVDFLQWIKDHKVKVVVSGG